METESLPKLFKDIAFVAYSVKNMKAARAFYEGTLGLAVTANWQDQWVEYDIGGGTLAIVIGDERYAPGVHGAVVGIEVTDLDRVVDYLKARSVTIHSGPDETPVCRTCTIRDPDGNDLILHSRKQ